MLIDMHIATYLPTKKQVGIDEVKKGERCNCVCNSCEGKLSAKQGGKNQWHFSHIDSCQKDCNYSFWVSVRSLSEQIICDTMFLPINFKYAPFGFMRIHSKTKSARWKGYCFDMLLETSEFDIYVNFLTNENKETRNRVYTQQANDYFNPIILLQIDLSGAEKNKKNIGKFLQKIILGEVKQKSFFAAHYHYGHFVKDSYYPYLDYLATTPKSFENKNVSKYSLASKERQRDSKKQHNNSYPLEIEKDEITLFLATQKNKLTPIENLKKFGFFEFEITNEDIRTCSEMVAFIKSIKKLNIELHGSDTVIATYHKLQCVRYKNTLYFFAEISNNFVMYTADIKNFLYLQKRIKDYNEKIDIVSHIEDYLKDSDKF